MRQQLFGPRPREDKRRKGADTASATTVVVGTDGDIFDMTGTTTVTAFTIAKGREVTYQFDGAVTLTHHATNLILPGAANITTAAGDILKLTAYDTDKVYGTFHRAASVKQIAQIVSDIPGTGGTGTTQIPFDDTIPQNTEGDQYLSVAITPKNASSTLIIDVAAMASHSFVGVTVITAALFQDSTAGALRASGEHNGTTDSTTNVSFRHIMTAGTTSATTFKVRVGGNQAGTTTFNGNAGGQRLGTVAASGLVITEILP